MALLPAVTPALTAPGQGCFFAAARIGPQAAPAFGGGTQPFGLRRRLRRRACGPPKTLPPKAPKKSNPAPCRRPFRLCRNPRAPPASAAPPPGLRPAPNPPLQSPQKIKLRPRPQAVSASPKPAGEARVGGSAAGPAARTKPLPPKAKKLPPAIRPRGASILFCFIPPR